MNNKGFAISTLLYGLLAVLILLMAAILSSLRVKRNVNKDISDQLRSSLDTCSGKLVKYESCITKSNSLERCSVEESQYLACIGSSSALDGEGYSVNKLRNNLVNTKTLRKVDNKFMLNRPLFVFNGYNPNNYISYEGRIGRIIYIDSVNNMKVVFTEEHLPLLPYGINQIQSVNISYRSLWINSRIRSYLNDEYKPTFNNTSKFNPSTPIGIGGITTYTNILFPDAESKNNDVTIYSLASGYSDKDNIDRDALYTGDLFNTISLVDVYLTVRNTPDCFLMGNENLKANCLPSSFLYNLDRSWTLNPNAKNNNEIFTNKGDLAQRKEALRLYPTTFFNGKTKIIGGVGTRSNPYVLN